MTVEPSHSTEDRVVAGPRAWPFVVLALAVWAVSLATLGSSGFFDPDEPRYAGSAREMLDAGDWWLPRFNDEYRIVKPILPYWAILGSFLCFGVNELAARLPSLVAGLGTLLLTGWMGRRLAGPRVGGIAMLALAVSPLPLAVTRLSTPDAALTFWVTLTMALYLSLTRRESGAPGGAKYPAVPRVGFFLALAAGFLVKGPVALVIPAIVIALDMTLRRDLGFLRRAGFGVGSVAFLAIALPWFVAVALHPEIGGARVFFEETLGRYFGSEDFHGKPFYYYPPVAMLGFFPWSFVVIAAAVPLWRRGGAIEHGGLRVAIVWAVATVAFFSLSPNKLPTYLMPIGAPMAILAAAALDAAFSGAGERAERRSALAEGVVLLAAAVGGGVVIGREYPDALRIALPVLGLAGVAGAGLLAARGRAGRRVAIRTGAMVLVAAYSLVWLVPEVAERRSYRWVAERLEGRIQPGDLLVEGWFHQPGLVYYSGHTVVRLDSFDDLAHNYAAPRPMYGLLEDHTFAELSERMGEEPQVLHRVRDRVLFCNGAARSAGATR